MLRISPKVGVVKTAYLSILLVLFILILIMTVGFYLNSLKIKKCDLRDQLLFVANELNFELQDTYKNAIKEAPNTLGSNKEKVLSLNTILQPSVERISSSHPNISLGYYDIRFDSIIAIRPEFNPSKLIMIPRSYPYFKSYQSGKVEFVDNITSVAWNGESIIAVTVPYYLDGKIVGHIWANQKANDLYTHAIMDSLELFTGSTLLLLTIGLIIWLIIRRINYSLKQLVQSFLDGKFDPESGLLFNELSPLVEAVKKYSDELLMYRSIVRDSTDAILCFDLEGNITYFNETATSLFGYSSTEVIGHKVDILSAPGEEGDLVKIIDRIKAGDEIPSYDVSRRKKDGKLLDISNKLSLLKDTEGNLMGISMISRDLTEENKRQRELVVLNERFAKVFHSSPIAMSIIRKSDRRYLDVNDCYLNKRGMSREIIGQIANVDNLPGYSNLFDIMDKANSIRDIEIDLTDNNGNTVGSILLSAEKIMLDGEECILFASSEITELKQLQAELTRLDRLNIVGQMAAGIGHEIRNPMTTVRGFLQLMGAKTEFISAKSTIELMISELDRANAILTEYLSLAKDKKTNLRPENINTIITNIFPLLQADAFNQNKDCKVILGNISTFVYVDGKEIIQLVLNICRNGLESMDNGGCLIIKTEDTTDEVILTIEDEGCGIPTEHLEKLGTPFFSTKSKGTGLGLAICYRIAHSNHAKIDVSSSYTGTIFKVRFSIPRNLPQDLLNEA